MKSPQIIIPGLISLFLLLLLAAGSADIICLPLISSAGCRQTPTPRVSPIITATPKPSETVDRTVTPTPIVSPSSTVSPTPTVSPAETVTNSPTPESSPNDRVSVVEMEATGLSDNVTLTIPPSTPLAAKTTQKLKSLQGFQTDDEGEAILRTTKCQAIRLYKKGSMRATYCSRSAAYTNSASCFTEGLWSVFDSCKTSVKRLMETPNGRLNALGTWYIAGYSKKYNVTFISVLKDPKKLYLTSPVELTDSESVEFFPFKERKQNGDDWEYTISKNDKTLVDSEENVLAGDKTLLNSSLPTQCPKLNQIEQKSDWNGEYKKAEQLYNCLDELGIDFKKNLPSILEQYQEDARQSIINLDPFSQTPTQPRGAIVFPLEPPKSSRFPVDFKEPGVVGDSSRKSETFTLSNFSGIELNLRISKTGANSQDFSFDLSKKCAQPIAPPENSAAAQCEIEVKFTPSGVGTRRAELVISHNADASLIRIPLTGVGREEKPAINANPGNIDFTVQDIADSPVRRIDVSLPGARPVEISSVYLDDRASRHFRIKSTSCSGKILEAGCFIEVEFISKDLGAYKETVTIKSQYVLPSGTVPITDVKIPIAGEKASPTFTLVEGQYCFARQKVYRGKKSDAIPDKALLLTNTGKVQVRIDDLKIKTGLSDFLLDLLQTTCGGSLKPGESCRIAVGFTPRKRRVREGVLQIFSNVAGSPTEIRLSGVGKPRSPILRFYYKHLRKYRLRPCS